MPTAYIIDDEYRARKVLRDICDRFIPDLSIVGEAEDIFAVAREIAELGPELLFLDVEMPKGKGLTLLEMGLPTELYVIITTAHPHYAIEALRVKADDYLVKPIGISDLEKALDRFRAAQLKRPAETSISPAETPGLISVSTGGGLQMVRIGDILHCASAGNYTVLHLENGRQLIDSRNLKYFTAALSSKGFYRVHHGHLINEAHLAEVNSKSNYCMLRNGQQVNISQRKKAAFLQYLRQMGEL